MLLSSENMPITVQKRSKFPSEVLYQPIVFEPDLPVSLNPHSDPGEAVNALHYHNALEISLCTNGHGIFFIEQTVYPYGEGTVVQVAPNVLHIAHSEGRQAPDWLTLYVDLHYLGAAFSAANLPVRPMFGSKVLERSRARRLAEDIRCLSNEYHRKDDHSRLGLSGRLNVVLAELARGETPLPAPREKPRHGFDKLAPALNKIATGLDAPLPVDVLARSCFMSESNFRRRFRSVMGASPHQYILNTRIQFAKTLLQDRSLSILEISVRCGFETLSTFNRAFLKRTGMSPRQWRNR